MQWLQPYKPSRSQPWDHRAAGHLLRRAGFAASPAELARALEAGPQATVDWLLQDGDCEAHRELDALGKALAVRNEIESLRGWWLLRMCRTERPLRARMALLWHDHFATSYAKVGSAALMLQQLRTFERHGLDDFETLLLAISRDPAMIVWLDGDQNIKGRANENYARELFELFSLGEGNYSEQDIKEAARAFTGWHQRAGRFRYVAGNHDDTSKRVLGSSGNLNGEDVVRIALQQPACGRFLARKLLQEFVTPRPEAALLEAVADRLRETNYNLRATLRTLFASKAMFADGHRWARIKSPCEFAIGLVRSLQLKVSAGELASSTAQMGQRLFEPPSVEGWKGHRNWLNSATMLVRMNVVEQAVSSDRFDPQSLFDEYGESGEEPLAFFARLLLDAMPPDLQAALRNVPGEGVDQLRAQIRLLLSVPNYHLA